MSIANYKEHREAFSALLENDCDKPILLFKGESGKGKSTLLKYCRTLIDKKVCYVAVDLNSSSNLKQIFYKLVENLDSENIGTLKQYLNEIAIEASVSIDGNTQGGVGNIIHVDYKNSDMEKRAERYTTLTKSLVNEIEELKSPYVLLVDAYEKANGEIKNWIDGDLLNSIANSKKMRIVIAGQNVPDSFEWNYCSELKELDGVHEAEEWLKFIKARGFTVPSTSPVELLRGFCIALNGNPAAIMKLIEKFPRIQ